MFTPRQIPATPRQIPATLRQPRQASREAKHNLLCLSSVVDPFPSPSIDPLHRKNSQLSALSEAAPSESALSSQRSHSSAAAEPKPIQVLPKQPVAAAVRPLPQQRQLVSGPAVQALQLGATSPPATPNPLDRLLRSRPKRSSQLSKRRPVLPSPQIDAEQQELVETHQDAVRRVLTQAARARAVVKRRARVMNPLLLKTARTVRSPSVQSQSKSDWRHPRARTAPASYVRGAGALLNGHRGSCSTPAEASSGVKLQSLGKTNGEHEGHGGGLGRFTGRMQHGVEARELRAHTAQAAFASRDCDSWASRQFLGRFFSTVQTGLPQAEGFPQAHGPARTVELQFEGDSWAQ